MTRRARPTATHRHAGDHTKFASFVTRIIRAHGRRVADADPEDLGELLAIRAELDAVIDATVAAMRERGVTWQAIADVTHNGNRTSAQKRWGSSGVK